MGERTAARASASRRQGCGEDRTRIMQRTRLVVGCSIISGAEDVESRESKVESRESRVERVSAHDTTPNRQETMACTGSSAFDSLFSTIGGAATSSAHS